MMDQPVADHLYQRAEGEVRILAGRDRESGGLIFPMPLGLEAERFDAVPLPAAGTLWSWTVQRFPPKPPYDGAADASFRPYGVAYVAFDGALIVEGRIAAEADLATLRIGMPVRTVEQAYGTAPGGASLLTYAFAPEQAA